VASAYGQWRVVYVNDHGRFKLCQIFFGRDGSYYVTSPYHPAAKALLMKATVNYNVGSMTVPFEEALDLAGIDDEEKRVKLSHHRDGFLQFSGQGVTSGRDVDGTIRGVGVMSWSLESPVYGPAFGVSVRGVEQFERATELEAGDIEVREDAIPSVPGFASNEQVLVLEGFYFPPLWHRFTRRRDGVERLSIVHPSSAVLELRVLAASDRCDWPGMIGIELRREPMVDSGPSPSFIVSGSTGNLRRNEDGDLLGDGIFCFYPGGDIGRRRTLDYTLQNVPAKVPPETPAWAKDEHGTRRP
jgi:hypothetical protein